MTPRLTSGWPNLALALAMRKSQARASSQPPPRAKPLTAAITGLSRSSRLRNVFWPSREKCRGLVLGLAGHLGDVGPGDEGLARRR